MWKCQLEQFGIQKFSVGTRLRVFLVPAVSQMSPQAVKHLMLFNPEVFPGPSQSTLHSCLSGNSRCEKGGTRE